ncbi:glycosyltransferase family 39 protein [Parablautia muri]|uniref:Glycosyltransferase RgtA/B/C/D-like domain-containing protein n=1 Tax=Parablautia muri TaxID=2320879 RepID=A0A9X5GTV5_9FIRM|nr:glycosyltransferase family 39 protein [Parablautia muri]NBJ93402.1 hypothetical protein [Parablautia muri]
MKNLKINMVRFCLSLCMIPILFMLGSVFVWSMESLWWIACAGVGGVFVYLLYVGSKKENFFDRNYQYIVISFLMVIGAFQLSKAQELRFIPSFDLDAIYGGALEWLRTGTFAGYYDYFDWFPNNLGGLSLLYFFLRVGSLFSSDYFWIAACGNEILLLLTYLFISLSARKLWGSCCGVIGLIMAGCMVPLLFMTDAFYTDSLSILFPVFIFYLSLKIEESKGSRIWGWCALSGWIVIFGTLVKSTVLIIAVAILMSFLIRKKWLKAGAYFACVGVICTVVTFLFHQYIYTYHLDPALAQVKNTPYSHWIMMGLNGEGGYNPEDYEFTRSFHDPEKRNQAIKKEIQGRVSKKGIKGMAELYAVKLYRCFGDGTLGLSDFLDDSPEKESVLHEFLLYGGKQYGLYHGFCCCILYAFLLLGIIYVWIVCIKGGTGTKECAGSAIALPIALCGLILFLMNWEVSPRYITNYVPVLLLLAAGGSKELVCMAQERKWNKKGMAVMDKYGKEIKIFTTAILFRVLVYLFSVCMMAILGDFSEGIAFSDFLEAWKRWDSAHYINIAENGYGGAIENGEHIFLVFYPLYPWLMRTLNLAVGDIRLCGILISIISYAVGCVFFRRIVKTEYGEKAAGNALILLSIFPFAFFFGSIATESLFFAITAAFFYCLRKHEWGMVALLGFFACLTKVQGLLLAFSVLVELLYAEKGFSLLRDKRWKDFFGKVIWPGCICALMLGGFWIYLLINYLVEGDFLKFMYYQKNHWGNALCPIWKTIGYIKDNALGGWYTSTGMSLWVPELFLFAVYLIAIVYGVCKKLRPMYLVYLITFFMLTYSSTWLISAGRYTLSALPIFMLAGEGVEKKEKWKIPVVTASAMAMMLYMTGYYSWKQIM